MQLSLPMLFAGLPLMAVYGDQVTVEARFNNLISPGWVVISERPSSALPGNAHFPTKVYQILKNLNGAPLGAVEEILGQSPIPEGWQIVQTRGNKELDKYRYNIRYQIMKIQVTAESAASASSAPAVTQTTNIHYDIAGLDWKRQDQEKQRLAEEKKGHQEAVKAEKERTHNELVRSLQEGRGY